jgi:GNAT superfamily N-acetyltransferase
MNKGQYIEAIVKGVEVYFRSFALADGISHQNGDIEWIAPLPGFRGPALVFRVSLSDVTGEVIERLIPDLQNGNIPSCWVLSPLSNPEIFDVLLSNGFKGGAGSGEYGMAMDVNSLSDLRTPSNLIEVKKVTSVTDFKVWMDVVNTALHGWAMLTIEQYSAWLEREGLAFYLGYLDGMPVSTAATFRDGKSAGVEFVSTLKEYRRQGAAYAVCHKALCDLQGNNVETATLVSLSEADRLYETLGFRPYYEQLLFSFQKAGHEA